MIREPRIENPAHRKFVATLECLVCGDNTSVEAAHIRYADRQAGKRDTGGQEKSHDIYILPMCSECHRKQHKVSERGYWEAKNIDAVKVAQALFIHSGNAEKCLGILEANRPQN